MKRLQQKKVGATKRQANVLTEANEELVWSKDLPLHRVHWTPWCSIMVFCYEKSKRAPPTVKHCVTDTGY